MNLIRRWDRNRGSVFFCGESSVVSEITDNAEPGPCRGWVLYDGQCLFCIRQAQRFGKVLRSRGFGLASLQTPWVRERLAIPEDRPLTEMLLLTATGRVLGGADALVYLARRVWWGWPLYAVAQMPGMRRILWAAYHWIAARRYRLMRSCSVSETDESCGPFS